MATRTLPRPTEREERRGKRGEKEERLIDYTFSQTRKNLFVTYLFHYVVILLADIQPSTDAIPHFHHAMTPFWYARRFAGLPIQLNNSIS